MISLRKPLLVNAAFSAFTGGAILVFGTPIKVDLAPWLVGFLPIFGIGLLLHSVALIWIVQQFEGDALRLSVKGNAILIACYPLVIFLLLATETIRPGWIQAFAAFDALIITGFCLWHLVALQHSAARSE